MVRRKYLNVPSYILCHSCLCVIVCNWMYLIISKDTPGDPLVVWNSLTSMTTFHAPMVPYWRQKMCRGFYLLCGQLLEYGEHMKGVPSAHNAAAVGDIYFCTTIAITCNVRGCWVAIQLSPTPKSYTRWYFKNHITSSCYSAVGLGSSSTKSL